MAVCSSGRGERVDRLDSTERAQTSRMIYASRLLTAPLTKRTVRYRIRCIQSNRVASFTDHSTSLSWWRNTSRVHCWLRAFSFEWIYLVMFYFCSKCLIDFIKLKVVYFLKDVGSRYITENSINEFLFVNTFWEKSGKDLKYTQRVFLFRFQWHYCKYK